MQPATISTEEKKRYPYLDALRGIAILLVIGYHTTIFTFHPPSNILFRVAGEGARGVQLFYIVSALTLFMSLAMKDFIGKKVEQIKFFVRRFFRIAPMFYFAIIVFCLGAIFFPVWKHWFALDINPASVISSVTFTNNFIPPYMNAVVPGDWSIAIEMFFYLLVPLLFLRIKDLATAKKYFLWTLGIASFIEFVLPLSFPASIAESVKVFLFYSIPIQLPVFMLGFVAFFLLFKNKKENTFVSYKKELLFLFGITGVYEIVFVVLKFLLTHTVDTSLITPRVYIEAVCFLALILALSKGYVSFLQNTVLQYIGKISYSIYLIHFISFAIVTKNSLYPRFAAHFTNGYEEYIVLFVLVSAVSIAIASVTFRYIEQPGQQLGARISKQFVSRFEKK